MSKASLKEDSVGDVKVGELGFGSVAEGGSFIALPNADSVEIKLEGGVGSIPSVASKSKSTTIKESSVASKKKNSKGDRGESKEGLVIGEGGEDEDDDAVSAKSGVVSVASLAAREGVDQGNFEEKSNSGGGDARREPSGVVGQGEDAFGMNSSVADGSVESAAAGGSTLNNHVNNLAMDSTASANMIGAGSISSSVLEEERAKYVFCYLLFFLLFLFVMSLSLSYPSIAAYLHSLTPHGTSLTIIPSVPQSINHPHNTHITYYNTGTRSWRGCTRSSTPPTWTRWRGSRR
jgi:hypothetical protein